MAKYSKKHKKRRKNYGLVILLVMLTVLLAFLIWLANLLGQQDIPILDQNSVRETNPSDAVQNMTESLVGSDFTPNETEAAPLELADGLQILSIGKYAGMYMEDGTNETVSDVMMIILENTAEQDLQLLRFTIEYPEMTAEFEITNLPAGQKVVALEKNRRPMTNEEVKTVQIQNVLFFPDTMGLQEERIRITGSNGSLKVENISGQDIAGDIYIYYKNYASDLLYGGITYRVTIKGGLAAGESSRVIAGHFSTEGSQLVLVECRD